MVDDTLTSRQFPPLLGWPRLRVALIGSLLLGIFDGLPSLTPMVIVVARAMLVGLATLLAFGVVERWPRRLPRWLARWALQLIAIAAVVPFAAFLAYWLSYGGHPNLSHDELRLAGYATLTFTGVLFAPWIAVAALVKQRDAFALRQASVFSLERSELERKASEARLRLLQAQVEPHFLFNTLANVQELVETGAPQAAQVLRSLVAYLRAAVPRLHDTATVQQELQLVRAYLDIMHMRMPDRLTYAIREDVGVAALSCLPMSLLPLVENAVRHGIDPSESGGRIEIDVERRQASVVMRVTDSGVGMKQGGTGLGTGLASLRERLRLAFADAAQLQVVEVVPHGVRAEVSFPAEATGA